MSRANVSELQSRRFARRGLLVAVFAIGLALGANAARASSAEFVVIVNKKNPAVGVSSEFLADAFLKKAVHWDHGASIRAADQRTDSAVRRAFSTTILKRTVAAVRNYWQQRIFSGREVPPPEFDSDAAVIHYVQKHDGGVGYVSPDAALDGVKVIPYR